MNRPHLENYYDKILTCLPPIYISREEQYLKALEQYCDELDKRNTPREKIVETYNTDLANPSYKCPICGEYVNQEDNYCFKCGQKFASYVTINNGASLTTIKMEKNNPTDIVYIYNVDEE